jgi:hypothetical protein
MRKMIKFGALGALMLSMGLAAGAGAQQAEHGHGGAPRTEHFDARYSHNHYYANHGYVVTRLPPTHVVVPHAGGPVYYSGGVWYAPHGPSYVVVAAPVGVFVPVLPPFYTTMWFAGAPYYYANDTYYQYRGDQGYEVVPPPGDQSAPSPDGATDQAPPGAPPDMNAPPPAGDDLFIYPQNGQSPDQQANDKYQCHQWALSQTGFDPTQAGGGVAPEQAAGKRGDYQRAMRACLEGRGYSVK